MQVNKDGDSGTTNDIQEIFMTILTIWSATEG